MSFEYLQSWALTSFLASLRMTPVFAFAPPFSMAPAPASVRVLLGLGLAASLAGAAPAQRLPADLGLGPLAVASAHELMIAVVFVLALQLMFAALQFAGRVIDIQAGFGLATLIDPTTNTQTPLIGSLFTFAAGWTFFAMGGHYELLRVFSVSLQIAPLGAGPMVQDLGGLTSFMALIFSLAFGVAGATILCLFIADVTIAMLSRTVPQMNVLILGFQAKTLIMLLVLPTTLGVSGAVLARMARVTLDAIPRLL